MHATAIFESCPDCHKQFRAVYDKDSRIDTEAARQSLGERVRGCDHETGGAL